MRVTKITAAVIALLYVFFWVLALHGASSLVAPLTVPLVLALLVAFGVWLNRFVGITPRRPQFEPRPDEAAPPPTSQDSPPDEDPTPDEGTTPEDQ